MFPCCARKHGGKKTGFSKLHNDFAGAAAFRPLLLQHRNHAACCSFSLHNYPTEAGDNMRNFEFDKSDSADIGTADIVDVRQNELPAESLRLDEANREAVREDALSTFRSSNDDDGASDNTTAKIAGAVLVGLLLVGGSIYAYESTTANRAPQTVAMLKPAQHQNVAAAQPVAPPVTTPDVSAPSATTMPSAVSTPKRAHSARAALATATPAPAASVAPESNSAPATSTASADSAINQPMTLTPETAPPPQQSAMEQPIMAPNVSGQTGGPTPEVANNNASSSVTLPSATVQPTLTAPAQPDAAAQVPATPAAPAPAPVQ
jgi:hypothetical protein